MQESYHLVALDNRLAKDFSLYSTAIDPKSLTPSMVSSVQTKNGSYHYTFALTLFLFFSFFFSMLEHLIFRLGHHHHHDHHLAPPLGMYNPILITTLDDKG